MAPPQSGYSSTEIRIELETERPDHRELRAQYSLRIVCGFFNVPQLFANKGCETGPPAYSPYPRRLERLTIC